MAARRGMTEPTPLDWRSFDKPPARGRSFAVVTEPARSCVVLLGMPYSGIRLCGRVLAVLGVDAGATLDPRSEVAPEVDLNGRILDLFGRGYNTQFHDLQLPAAWWTDARLHPLKRELAGFLRARAQEHRCFPLADPQTARLLPVWQQGLRDAGVTAKPVVCLRNPGHVARRLAAEEGLASEIGEIRWLTYMVDILKGLENFEAPVIEYETWFREPRENVAKLRRSLGLAWDQSEADLDTVLARIIEPGRGPHQQEGAEARLPLVRLFYELLRRYGEDAGARDELLSTADRIALYRQLNRPLEQEFETLSRVAAHPPGGQPAKAGEVTEDVPAPHPNANAETVQAASAGAENDAGGAAPAAVQAERPKARLPAPEPRCKSRSRRHRVPGPHFGGASARCGEASAGRSAKRPLPMRQAAPRRWSRNRPPWPRPISASRR